MTDGDEIESFEELLFNSVAFMTRFRCGFDGVPFKASDFQGVTRYNSDVSISCLGEAINNILAVVLHQIAETEKTCKKEEKKENIKGGQIHGEENNVQRGTAGDAGTDIQASGGLFPSRRRTGTGEAIESESIRPTTPGIFQGDAEEPIHEYALRGDSLPIPSGDQRQGARQVGATHRANGESTGSKRGTQVARHDAVGGKDEQHPISSQGDRERRDRVQLGLFPSITVKESIPFLKEECGLGGGSVGFPSGKRGWNDTNSKGIVDTGKLIGEFCKNGVFATTSKVVIHYSKKGAHNVPIEGDKFD